MKPFDVITLTPDDFDPGRWPVQPGDYRLGDPRGGMSIVVLGNPGPYALDEFTSIPEVAIVGNLTTENLGVEHVLKNLVSNPFIRRLCVLGRDLEGHLPGDALIRLNENGLGRGQRITGASGARPVLKNVLPLEVDHFREQIEIHDLRHREDRDVILKEVEVLASRPSRPFRSALSVQLVEVERAIPAGKLHLDPKGYFVIMVMAGRDNPICVEHYGNDGRLEHVVEGCDAATICSTLLRKKLVSRMDHALYLGRELARAELAVREGQRYVQDRAQGDLIRGL